MAQEQNPDTQNPIQPKQPQNPPIANQPWNEKKDYKINDSANAPMKNQAGQRKDSEEVEEEEEEEDYSSGKEMKKEPGQASGAQDIESKNASDIESTKKRQQQDQNATKLSA